MWLIERHCPQPSGEIESTGMRNNPLEVQQRALVCICVSGEDCAVTLKELLLLRQPDVEVLSCDSLAEVATTVRGRQFFLLFSASEAEWRRGAPIEAPDLASTNCLASFALTDSSEPEFLQELYEFGVTDYFLNVPAGCVTAVARIVREIQKRSLSGAGAKSARNDESLAEKVRRVTFRETVATINHQINNPLSEILATVEMLNSQENASSFTRATRLRAIQNSARRIQRVTRNLLEIVNPDSRLTPAGNMIELSQEPLLTSESSASESLQITSTKTKSRLKAKHFTEQSEDEETQVELSS